MKKITIIVASVGKNLELALEVQKILESKDIEVSLLNVVEMNLPLYTSKADAIHSAEKLMSPFREELNAEGFVFIAPEYNGGPPPAFNNFIAWVSRSTKNWREAFSSKPAMLASHSGGAGMQAVLIMRLMLSFIGMNVMGRQIVSSLNKPSQHEELNKVCDEFIRVF